MCCPLDQVNGRLTIQTLQTISFEEQERERFHLHATFDRTPENLTGRVLRLFQRLELAEKIAEIADETFHLFSSLLKVYTNALVYQTLRNLHRGAHEFEHVLHTFCFLGDVIRLVTGKFFEYQDAARTQLDYGRSAARVCHAIAHLFATAAFLAEHKLCELGRFEKFCKYAPVFSALGYALWTISLIWQRHQGIVNDHFASDLGIHLGGFLFEALPSTQKIEALVSYRDMIAKATALAGIVHAWCVVMRLMPRDREEISGDFVVSDLDVTEAHHPTHHHGHGHVD